MEISPNERYEHRPQPPKKRTGQIAAVVIAIVVIGFGAWWLTRPEPEPEIETIASEPAETVVEPKPVEPAVTPSQPKPDMEPAPPQPTLPSLDNSDKMVRDVLSELNDSKRYQAWLQSDNLIRRGTALTDGLARGVVLHKFLPVKPPEGKFLTRKEGQRYWVDPTNYGRYDTLVKTLTDIKPAQAAKTIHLFKPLLEAAFNEQGYKNRTFDATLIAAIDQLLATPVYEQPPELKLESVYFKYADDKIEKLTDGQKQLIRMGPANTRKVQEYLRKLRAELVK